MTHLRDWWFNFGEDGFWAYWLSLPWRCRLGFHNIVTVAYHDSPDYPWHAEYANECQRCGTWRGWAA